ncbi:MAG: RluA family pseudouridine synthase [Lachnospiraceae bacterium]|nr:RluA family pseudouridine synthase [Lachnospiraceae bacterium]
MKLVIINESESGQRLDKYLNKLLKEAGKSFLYKMLRKKNITLNNAKADGSEHLKAGDEIRLYFSDETYEKFAGKPVPVQPVVPPASGKKLPPVKIIYQDNDVMIVNKPAGILSQKANAEDVSLNEYILQYLLKKEKVTRESIATFRPSVCNRLDRNTSGIVTAGITYRGARELSRLLRERSADKRYLALVKGVLKRPAHLKGWLIKDKENNRVSIQPQQSEEAQEIETEYIPLGDNGRMTLLEIHLITGKSHQIRAHLASVEHPVIGDTKYGDELANGWYHRTYHGHFQLLHSWKLHFPAKDCELENLAGKTFRASLPENFLRVLEGEGLLSYVNMEQ